MFSKVQSAALNGLDAYLVRVEADISDGMPQLLMVGYLSSEVREAGDRVRTALRNTGILLPPKRITVNLAPAGIRKAGSRFDLPVAAAILASLEKIPGESLQGVMLTGELSLSGQVLPVSGILALVEAAPSGRGARTAFYLGRSPFLGLCAGPAPALFLDLSPGGKRRLYPRAFWVEYRGGQLSVVLLEKYRPWRAFGAGRPAYGQKPGIFQIRSGSCDLVFCGIRGVPAQSL